MAIIRKRRILIAAIAVAGIVFIWLLARPPESPKLFDYLARHPTACSFARQVFKIAGHQQKFEAQLLLAQVTQSVKRVNDTLKRAEAMQPAGRKRSGPRFF